MTIVVTDEWSDVDLTAIVADEAVTDLASQRPWLSGLGDHRWALSAMTTHGA